MAQPTATASAAVTDWSEPYEFDIGETVTLLWSPHKSGLIKGQQRTMNTDDQFLVEYVNNEGRLVEHFVFGSAIDHLTHH